MLKKYWNTFCSDNTLTKPLLGIGTEIQLENCKHHHLMTVKQGHCLQSACV